MSRHSLRRRVDALRAAFPAAARLAGGAAAALTVAVLAATGPASAQQARTLGTFEGWTALTFGEGKTRVCYLHAVPQSSEGDYTRRGATYVQVTHRPADKAFNEVSVTAGYGYKPGSEAEIEIDGNKYALFTQDGGAWARDATADAALIAAMKAGNRMVVRGSSARGTLTIDHYALKGFTAAHAAIGKACGAR